MTPLSMPTTSDTRRARSRIAIHVRQRPLGAFLCLSCLLSWWPAVLYAAGWSGTPIAGFGPFLAALIVIGFTEGRPGIAALWRSMRTFRGRTTIHLLAVATPIAVTVVAIALTVTIGGATPDHAHLALWTDIPITFLAVLLVPGLGGAWEEPGFRGYALNRFEQRFGALTGQLLLGAFWVLWHAPLFVTRQIALTDIPTIVAASLVIATVFHRSGNTVLTAMLLHATNNAIGGGYASQLFTGHDTVTFGAILAGTWVILAATLAAHSACATTSAARQQRSPLTTDTQTTPPTGALTRSGRG